MRTRIKFCGCTSVHDADLAVGFGVDAIGVIFAESSPRRVGRAIAAEIAHAVPAFISLVGVFVEPAAVQVQAAVAAGYIPQFSGNEPGIACESAAPGAYIKVFHLAPASDAPLDVADFERSAAPYARATWMFDTAVDGKHGGTGQPFDWEIARPIAQARRIIISGGLTADNVGSCIRRLRPYGVDVRSGIETNSAKDPAKMRAFVRAVKEADEQA